MDISGRIRAVLAEMPAPGGEARIYAQMVRAVLHPESPPPERIADRVDEPDEQKRWVHGAFLEAGSIRALQRFRGGERAGAAYPSRRFLHWRTHAERLVDRGVSPVEALWYHWLLLLGERHLGIAADRELLTRLWFRGLYQQTPAGHLHPLDANSLLDAFVYDELVAIHAAYNSAAAMKDPAMLDPVRRAVRWHVENTQPDNTTNEPWALAAFAALDDTGTFAEQQLHDAMTHLRNAPPLPDGRVPVALGLLADAVMTLENRD